MSAKFTPGPWTDQSIDESQWGVYDAAGNVVAQAMQIRPLRQDLKQVERSANARLIAAAPELLDALRHCVDWFDAMAWDTPAAKQARAAIAKATGSAE